jgi:hypothetical protein
MPKYAEICHIMEDLLTQEYECAWMRTFLVAPLKTFYIVQTATMIRKFWFLEKKTFDKLSPHIFVSSNNLSKIFLKRNIFLSFSMISLTICSLVKFYSVPRIYEG